MYWGGLLKLLMFSILLYFIDKIQLKYLRSSKQKHHLHVIPPSHLFGIGRNRAEPAGMKNIQNSRHIREGISEPSHTRGGMSRSDVGMEILYIFLDMRFSCDLNCVRSHSRANWDVLTAFERQSKDSDDIWIAF